MWNEGYDGDEIERRAGEVIVSADFPSDSKEKVSEMNNITIAETLQFAAATSASRRNWTLVEHREHFFDTR